MTIPGQFATGQYQAAIEGLKAVAHFVEVDLATFRLLLRSREHPTVVEGKTGAFWFKKQMYLTSYDGFVFVHKADKPIDFSEEAPGAFFVQAENISIPFL